MKYNIICNDCDSEYSIETELGLIQDDPKYCSICNSPDIIVDLEQPDQD